MRQYTILISDDQSHIRDSLSLLLEPLGYRVAEVASPAAVIDYVSKQSCDLLLMDMNYSKDTTSGSEGLDLVQQVREKDPSLAIIVMTAWANIELSVKAIKLGANDFVEKPWNNARLLSLINNQLMLAKERRDNSRLSELSKQQFGHAEIVAEASSMKSVMQLVQRTAKSDANILLTGESGVGKSLIAGLIHKLSNRSNHPLVNVNMGALADNLFESELFGHLKGAFTDAKTNRMGRFEMAEGGTLFLDEIANIPTALQAKLLRVLESSEYEPLGSSKTKQANVRIVSASNVNFEDEIAKGNFRQDLLYRLNTITIDIPALRNRQDDIMPLALSFLDKLKHKYRRDDLGFCDKAIKAMQTYHWPGNVRELSHCVERAVLMAEEPLIETHDLGLAKNNDNVSIDGLTLAEAERYLIDKAMQECHGNVAEAAEKLGISRAALYRRLDKNDDTMTNV